VFTNQLQELHLTTAWTFDTCCTLVPTVMCDVARHWLGHWYRYLCSATFSVCLGENLTICALNKLCIRLTRQLKLLLKIRSVVCAISHVLNLLLMQLSTACICLESALLNVLKQM